MILFFERPATKEERFITLVDEARDVREAAKSIKEYAMIGGRKLREASGFDEIELLKAILNNCEFVSSDFAEYLIEQIEDTRKELYNMIDRYNDLANGD